MRQRLLSVIFVACGMPSFGGVVAPERAMAQLTCESGTGITDNMHITQVLAATTGGACESTMPTISTYVDLETTVIPRISGFRLLIPGVSNVVSGASNGARIGFNDGNGAVFLSALSCDGATPVAKITNVENGDQIVGEIELEDGQKCNLYAYWENGGNSVSFSGTTLERNGNVYTLEAGGILAGHVFGGTAVTIVDPVIARTQRIISNFIGRRAAQIVGKEPDLTKRLGDGGNGSSANGPVSVTGKGTVNNNNLAFPTSLRQVIGSTQLAKQKRIGDGGSGMALGARQEGGSLKDGPVSDSVAPKPRNGFGLWTEGTWARVDDDTAKSDFGLFYVGANYRFRDGLVVGVIAQFDRMDEEDDTNDFAIEGKGWMARPYVVARIGSNLIFDARAAWGKSDNEVSPYNAYTDSFDGQRRLVRGRLTGDFTFGAVHVAPHIGVIYFEEQQKAYTDSNGYAIGEQTVKLGRLTFGPKVSTSFTRPDGTTIAPFIAIQGIWDFKRTDQIDIDTGFAVTGSDKFRARTEAGLSIRLPQGVAITGEGFYDGIGADGFNAYGGSVKVGVPF